MSSSKKPEVIFTCADCGAQFPKWAGRCTECGHWGTVSQEAVTVTAADRPRASGGKTQSFEGLGAQTSHQTKPTGLAVFDRLLSGGLVPGSVTLLGGEPGIGKSTLLAQLALVLAGQNQSILYVTGEESPTQVLLRLKRLTNRLPERLLFLDQTQADVVAATIEEQKPALTIIDSVQTLRLAGVPGEAGNPSQVKASAAVVSEAAKRSHAPVILVGQVTKDGDLAGPRLLEHLVDTVMMMEGDRDQVMRLLRVLKHRFGSTEEVAVLSMTENGLEEILDPSSALIAHRPTATPGTTITCLAQGSRPMLVEIQALVTPAGYGTPMRRATGIDTNRLNLLLAVLARRAGVNFGDQDVFVNAVGGIDAKEPATDLAICLALVSAKLNLPLSNKTAAWGEVGLSGELRPAGRTSLRIKECVRLGFSNLILPKDGTDLKETNLVQLQRQTVLSDALRAAGLGK